MKTINLYSLANMPENQLDRYRKIYDFDFKSIEQETLKSFLDYIKKKIRKELKIGINGNAMKEVSTDGYTVGFKLLGDAEFDILKNTEKCLLNIELKSKFSNEKKIIKQLKQHKYYLSKVKKECVYYTYVMEHESLYELVDKNGEDALVKCEKIDRLVE